MPHSANRVSLQSIHLTTVFPTLKLFDSFRMALQPTKLLLGVMFLVLLYLGGVALDTVWGPQPGPVYVIGYAEPLESYRVFRQITSRELNEFHNLVHAAVHLDLGMGDLAEGHGRGVVGSIWHMLVVVPGWVWDKHPGFFTLFGAYSLFLFMALGGAISRLAVMQACTDTSDGLFETVVFTAPRIGWLILAPAIPLACAGALCVTLAVLGAILFNVPGLNVVGSLVFGLMFLIGFAAAYLLILSAAGISMMPAALAVEGTDAFDIVSRVCTFLIFRPIRYLLLVAIVVVFGAAMYLLVGTIMYFAFWLTTTSVGMWSADFNKLILDQEFGRMPLRIDTENLSWLDRVASSLLLVWSRLWFGSTLAFVVSYVFSAQTWIYLLLRREVDGTAFSDCYIEGPSHVNQAHSVEDGGSDHVKSSTRDGSQATNCRQDAAS